MSPADVETNGAKRGLDQLVASVRASKWEGKLSEWSANRERNLPRLHGIIDRFLAGEMTAAAFRHEMDSFGKQTKFAGFQGIAGQMFFNLLVKAAEEDALLESLKSALPPPADDADVHLKMNEFLDSVEGARDRAHTLGLTLPARGYAPYFLSFFWEAREREKWPIYYPASRETLTEFGLFVNDGPYADRYLRFRDQIDVLRHALNTTTWGVEAGLWSLKEERKESDHDVDNPEPEETLPRRAWLMRGANIGGENFVPHFLTDRFIAVGWDAKAPLIEGMSRAEIVEALQESFPEESIGTIRNWAGIDHRFVNLVELGDLVLTPQGPDLYIGRVSSAAKQTTHEGHTIVRRSVNWINRDSPVPRSLVKSDYPSLYSKMRTLLTITDLKEDATIVAALAGLVPSLPPPPAETGIPAATASLAQRLFLPVTWLQDIIDALNEKRQLVFYGPPGTGKTFVAQALGEHVEEAGGEYEVVQFHPSYSYEDFFEGFRPRQGAAEGTLSFELSPGPLKRIADEARINPTRPYLLIVDEINRGNIAKIFGELYFLLEYRNRAIGLQYSPEARFSLPENLYMIGTMNTADRSIALVDSALRRRFYFIPFAPTESPLRDVLPRWLDAHGLGDEATRLLDGLNTALEAEPGVGDEFAIGPSYFMVGGSEGGPDLEHVWRYAIIPLLEERFYGAKRATDVAADFGLAAIRRRLAAAEPEEAELEIRHRE